MKKIGRQGEGGGGRGKGEREKNHVLAHWKSMFPCIKVKSLL
jgi:hypothetical protein